ncbi:hypothetical protein [Verticiella alkaliphila]|nr:hypothetical protein [Verticiella sp. GG226]
MAIAYLIDIWKRLFAASPVCVDLRHRLLEQTSQERRGARGGR